jgi:hypothetical protein
MDFFDMHLESPLASRPVRGAATLPGVAKKIMAQTKGKL